MKRAGAILLALLAPTAAHACAACATGNARNAWAFLVTTIVLSLLPLALIVTGALLLRHRLTGQFDDRDAWAPPDVEPRTG